jgi:hypothetical protein
MPAAKPQPDMPTTIKIRARQNAVGGHGLEAGDEAELEQTPEVLAAIAHGVFEIIEAE